MDYGDELNDEEEKGYKKELIERKRQAQKEK
jgi:hypothetical protein